MNRQADDAIQGENEDFTPLRRNIDIQVGSLVRANGKVYRIAEVLDFESVVGVDVDSDRSKPLRIHDLRPIDDGKEVLDGDLGDITDDDWSIAESRYVAIKPLLEVEAPGRSAVSQRADEVGVDTATLYRWLKRFKAYESAVALIPQKRGWTKGKSRIDPFAEKVIQEVIQDYYLTTQRSTAQKVITEVKRRCLARAIAPPSPSTIRSRLSSIPEKERLRRRGFKERAKNKFLPAAGTFPNADFPLAVVQIDHTPADIILVDDVYRKPIGRPWITLAIDVYSRLVTGYYLSFDPPSETSVAMCVAHSTLPKEEWLLLHHVEAEWPVWGVPKTIHVDNGADFRSNNFQQSCLAYGIHLEFRPVKQPRYGGHIERMLGTLLREIHDLPGTTFSSVKHKEDYDSEKHATLTKSEFEEWLVTLICKVYHQRVHSSLAVTPLKKWEMGVFGTDEGPGVGIPPRPGDRLTVLLDFLPVFRRTIQTFGVTIDGMTYYAEVLRSWINSTDPDSPKKKRQFVFRRDPRDISSIWFFDPELQQYFKVPFADQSLPSMSIWEYRQARELLKKHGAKGVDERQLLDAVTEMREKVDKAKEKSKKARRQAQRRAEHERKITPANPLPQRITEPDTPVSGASDGLIDGDIEFVGEIG